MLFFSAGACVLCVYVPALRSWLCVYACECLLVQIVGSFHDLVLYAQIFMHSGVWEKNKVTGKMNWSDTGSEDYDSPGDIVKVGLRHDIVTSFFLSAINGSFFTCICHDAVRIYLGNQSGCLLLRPQRPSKLLKEIKNEQDEHNSIESPWD